MRIVDSQVDASSKWAVGEMAPPAGASWRFEAAPAKSLDQVSAARQNKLEAAAAQALARYGFQAQPQKADAPAQYSVLVMARIKRLPSGPFDTPREPWGIMRPSITVTGTGQIVQTSFFLGHEMPWYIREVSLVLRDTQDNRVVYVTQARHEGRWSDDEAVLPAMLQAALEGYPKPPEGKRMVNIEIPR